jgi:DNA polymerase III subunit epsilon
MTPLPFTGEINIPANPDFVALDFETANRDANSACSIGLAFVKDGLVAANPSWLIRPPRLYFEPSFIDIHGIRPETVENQPMFSELWDLLHPYLEGHIVIAHNAEFDINVLRFTLAHFSIPHPSFRYCCTKIISQKTWPSWKAYNLASLAKRHGFEFLHHDAAEDARVCAGIALAAAKVKAARDFDTLLDKLHLSYGRLAADLHEPVSDTFRLPELGSFAGWDQSLHRRAEQLKRRQRAEELTDYTIDHQQQRGLINGYTVSLENCSCIDFRERRLPCKHIYRLYKELNKPEDQA